MADINLTQEDADALLAMEKHKADDAVYEYPSLGGGIRVPLLSPDKREALTCISTAKATAIAGLCRSPPSGFQTLAIPGCCC